MTVTFFQGAAKDTEIFAQLLEKHGLGARVEGDAATSSANIVRLNSAGVRMVCLSYFELGNSAAHLRYSIRRIRRQVPGAAILAGLWGHEPNRAVDEQIRADAGADAYALSLRDAVRLCLEAASADVGHDAPERQQAGSSAA